MKSTGLKKGKIFILGLILAIGATAFTINNGKYYEIAKNLEIFSNIYKEINMLYVDDLDPGELMKTGVDAMLESLDPYTNYISESEIEGYRFNTMGKYKGIGARVVNFEEYPTIVSIYKDSPSDKAGLRVGDRFVSINGNEVANRSFDEVDAILKGSPGTVVSFKIKRSGLEDYLDIELIRDDVVVDNVPYYGMVSDKIAYISLTTFTQAAGKNIENALKDLKKSHEIEGLILDLRGNGGGLLMEAVNISNIFIPKGELVVSTKGKSPEWDKNFVTRTEVYDSEIKLAVLINGRSASASEIVSGVIQDYDRGLIIGQKSYGKGLVQNTKDVGFNSKVKLTTAKYYIPSGRCIQSVEYKDGEPVDIPEESRAKFQTKNGRMVLDGGGVLPDLLMDKPVYDACTQALIGQYKLFNFVDKQFAGIDSIPDLEAFRFEAWEAFTGYLKNAEFEFMTDSEKTLESLSNDATSDDLAIQAQIKSIQSLIEKQKSAAIEENKALIIDLIEKEVANKFGYQKGRTQMNLRNDKEVDFAIEVLLDTERYNKILN
ncbi:MAG: S41 family peptidase [Saprospiraceae bacterium]|nr:S41 family peptidase [Saprospiraceae bacterium]